MSATNRGAERVENDNYPTPGWCVRRLFEAWRPMTKYDDSWLEPCAGDGAIIREIQHAAPRGRYIDAIEIRPEARPTLSALSLDDEAGSVRRVHVFIGDYLTAPPRHYGVAMTNPPFSLAEQIIKKALSEADWVVMLLRMNFLGSDGRANWLRNEMPDIYTLPDRPNFVASSKCKGNATRDVHGSDYQTRGRLGWKPEGCGWNEKTPIAAPKFECCPHCGGKVQRSTSDSAEYGWFIWTPERGRTLGQTRILASTPEEERKAA